MIFEVETFKDINEKEPVRDFIASLPVASQAKILRELYLLQDYGTELKYPHTEKIKGDEYKNIWELRIKQATNDYRIFYFLAVGSKFILLHGFIKKQNKTPKRELEIAKSRMEDYNRRCVK